MTTTTQAVANTRAFTVLATADVDAIRHEDFEDRDHLVVPVVALVEGVIQSANSERPELALSSVFGQHAQGWDGRPVLLGHPKLNGAPISANTPEVIEKEAFGRLFNTRLDGAKLKTEAWIDLEKVAEMGGEVADKIAALESGELTEISTGLFVVSEIIDGKFNGEDYEAVWNSIVPDHLAILPEGSTGACSIKDGCGAPRLNETFKWITDAFIRANEKPFTTETDGHSHEYDGILDETGGSNEHTHRLIKDADGNITGFGNTAGHTHELAVTTEAGHSPKKRKKSKKGKKMSKNSGDATLEEATAASRSIMDSIYTFFTNFGARLQDNKAISDTDRRMAIAAALDLEDPARFHEVVAVFEDIFIYVVGFGNEMFSRSFIIKDDDSVTLGADSVQVRPQTEFVPVKVDEKEIPVTNKERVSALIANEQTKLVEDDREWLKDLDEKQLAHFEPVVIETTVQTVLEAVASSKVGDPIHDGIMKTKKFVSAAGQIEAKLTDPPEEKKPETPKTPKTLENYIQDAPAEIQEVLGAGVRMHQARRKVLVEGLKANARCEYSEDELSTMKLVDLERMSKLANIPDYSGQGGTRHLRAEDPNAIPEPPQVFPKKVAA